MWQGLSFSRIMQGNWEVKNYVEIDATIPNEAASEITLDNATSSSLDALRGMGKKLGAERYTEDPELRKFFLKPVKPFIADTQ